jgi:hypothetical protein
VNCSTASREGAIRLVNKLHQKKLQTAAIGREFAHAVRLDERLLRRERRPREQLSLTCRSGGSAARSRCASSPLSARTRDRDFTGTVIETSSEHQVVDRAGISELRREVVIAPASARAIDWVGSQSRAIRCTEVVRSPFGYRGLGNRNGPLSRPSGTCESGD